MHRSRLAGFIVDCRTGNLSEAAEFWSAALGMKTRAAEGEYVHLDAAARDLHIEVQRVSHESRVHLDIESDDIPAEEPTAAGHRHTFAGPEALVVRRAL